MNKLSLAKQATIIRSLVEGNSIRATVRMTGASKNTIAKLLVDLGHACLEFQDKALKGIKSQRVQCDEVWSFVGCKEKNLSEAEKEQFGRGDVWTWTAIDADTKLMISWYVGDRDPKSAYFFMTDLVSRLKNRVQLTTDGHRVYLNAVEAAFGSEIDYAMLVKLYGGDSDSEKRYSPAQFISTAKTPISGNPDPKHISTSYVERQNLTMRMGMRRFTRLTNAFSKKMENHIWAISLHFMYYNFSRVHQTLKTTPAVAAGVTDHVWSIEEIIGLLSN